MAATRLRLSPEHRNGNGNYLRVKHDGKFVPCTKKNELSSLVAAFCVLCNELGISSKEVRAHLDAHKPVSHD